MKNESPSNGEHKVVRDTFVLDASGKGNFVDNAIAGLGVYGAFGRRVGGSVRSGEDVRDMELD